MTFPHFCPCMDYSVHMEIDPTGHVSHFPSSDGFVPAIFARKQLSSCNLESTFFFALKCHLQSGSRIL